MKRSDLTPGMIVYFRNRPEEAWKVIDFEGTYREGSAMTFNLRERYNGITLETMEGKRAVIRDGRDLVTPEDARQIGEQRRIEREKLADLSEICGRLRDKLIAVRRSEYTQGAWIYPTHDGIRMTLSVDQALDLVAALEGGAK